MHGSGEGLVNIRLSLWPRSALPKGMRGRFDRVPLASMQRVGNDEQLGYERR